MFSDRVGFRNVLRWAVSLSSIGDWGVHNRGVLCKCGAYNGSNPSLFGDFLTFCGPACFITRADNLVCVRIYHYTCGYFIPRADILSRVRILIRLNAMLRNCNNVLKN